MKHVERIKIYKCPKCNKETNPIFVCACEVYHKNKYKTVMFPDKMLRNEAFLERCRECGEVSYMFDLMMIPCDYDSFFDGVKTIKPDDCFKYIRTEEI